MKLVRTSGRRCPATRSLPFAALLFLPLASAHAQSPDTLSLGEAARAALATHPLRAVPAAGQEAAEAAAREARSARLPRLSTEWTGTRHQEPMIVRPLHGFDPTSPPEFDRTLVHGTLSVSWTLFDGGARGARIGRAEAQAEVATASLRAAEADLLARVAAAYLAVLDARAAGAAYDAQIEALEAERTRVRRFELEGRVAHVEVLRAEAALSAALADRAAHDARRARAEAEFARLIGADVATVAALALAAPDTLQPRLPSRAELVSISLESSPRVVQARLRVAAADAARDEARSANLPSVSLAGRYDAYGDGSADLTAEWQGGVRLSYALFTGGQRSAAIARAGAGRAAATASLRLAELDVEAAIDDALTAAVEADARAAALEDAVASYRAVLDVERLALDEGAGVQSDFLRAAASLRDAETALSAARHARFIARVRLAQAAGLLTLDWLDNLARSM